MDAEPARTTTRPSDRDGESSHSTDILSASLSAAEDRLVTHTGPWARAQLVLSVPGGSLLFLRAFLGATFTYAGLEKLADPNFFRASVPGSFDQQLRGAFATSPLHGLLSLAAHTPVIVALLISFGELAVGIGTLLGLWGRVAAIAGALVSLLFFLSVSFSVHPYYYGSDIVFLFAWTPLIVAGPGVWSFDRFLARPSEVAQAPLPASPPSADATAHPHPVMISRRTFVRRGMFTGAVAAGVLLLGGVDAAVGRLLAPRAKAGQAAAATRSSGVSPSSRGTRLVSTSHVPVGGALSFTDPARGVPAFVVQPERGDFVAFSAVCTHAGCPVQFDGGAETFVCPCHGSVFSARTGAVLQGPAFLPLTRIAVTVGPGSDLYVDG